MYSKRHEIESIVEDLIENTIIEALVSSFSTTKDCEMALELLQEKLDELDSKVFKTLLD